MFDASVLTAVRPSQASPYTILLPRSWNSQDSANPAAAGSASLANCGDTDGCIGARYLSQHCFEAFSDIAPNDPPTTFEFTRIDNSSRSSIEVLIFYLTHRLSTWTVLRHFQAPPYKALSPPLSNSQQSGNPNPAAPACRVEVLRLFDA